MTPIIALIIQEALQYGPEFVKGIVSALQRKDVTVAEIESLFSGVKPYSSYGIPDKVPVTTTTTTTTNI